MGKLWGQRTLPVKTRLSRLHIALTMATLSMAGAADAVYADEAILDGDRHISHSVSYDGKVIVGAVDVSHLLIDGGTFSADQLVIGSKGQSQARVRVSNGAKLVNDEATIAYGVDDTQYEQRPQAVISGQGSEWRVNNKLAVAGVLDVLGGAKVSAGALAIASQPGRGKRRRIFTSAAPARTCMLTGGRKLRVSLWLTAGASVPIARNYMPRGCW